MPSIESLNQFPVVLPQCTIRFFDPSTPTDAEQLPAVADNPRVARYLNNFFPSPYTKADAEFWVADHSRQRYADRIAASAPNRVGLHGLCIEVDGRVCGGIGYRYNTDLGHRTLKLGYWLAEPVWGRGITTAAVRWLLDFIAREEPWVVRVEASPRVLEKAGFALESVRRAAFAKGDGMVYDAVVMVHVFEERLREGLGLEYVRVG
ncbi:acyl-CoA N-acyltransferase [Zopfochytrium polystomum]|nr:acyl-CoA N-acyltransferase [Zopfochytrium polystomum]